MIQMTQTTPFHHIFRNLTQNVPLYHTLPPCLPFLSPPHPGCLVQVCAALGKLPGQGGFGMRFSYRPADLDVYGWKPLWQARLLCCCDATGCFAPSLISYAYAVC